MSTEPVLTETTIETLQEVFSDPEKSAQLEDMKAPIAAYLTLEAEAVKLAEVGRDDVLEEVHAKQEEALGKLYIAVSTAINAAQARSAEMAEALLKGTGQVKTYVLKNEHGLEITSEGELQVDEENPENSLIVLHRKEFEDQVNNLTDLLTAQRISEEGDSATYVALLKKAFSNLSQESARSLDLLESSLRGAEWYERELKHELDFILQLDAQILAAIPFNRIEESDRAPSPLLINGRLREDAKVDREIGGRVRLATYTRDYLKVLGNRLNHLLTDVCSEGQIDAAERQARDVARKNQRSFFQRWIPLLWAVFVTLCMKGALAQSNNILLKDTSTIVLMVTFFASWLVSIYIGVEARAGRMRALQHDLKERIHDLFIPETKAERLRLLQAGVLQRIRDKLDPTSGVEHVNPDDDFRVPPEPLGQAKVLPGTSTMSVFAPGVSHRRAMFQMVAANGLLLLAPAAFFWLVWVADRGYDDHRMLIGTTRTGDPCSLARGRIVHETEEFYFVHSGEVGWQTPMHIFFPELFATPVARNLVNRTVYSDVIDQLFQAPKVRPSRPFPDCHESLRQADLPAPVDPAEPGGVNVNIDFSNLERLLIERQGTGATVDPELIAALSALAEAIKANKTLTMTADDKLNETLARLAGAVETERRVTVALDGSLDQKLTTVGTRFSEIKAAIDALAQKIPEQPTGMTIEERDAFILVLQTLIEDGEPGLGAPGASNAMTIVQNFMRGEAGANVIENLNFALRFGLGSDGGGTPVAVTLPDEIDVDLKEGGVLAGLLGAEGALIKQLAETQQALEDVARAAEPPVVFSAVLMEVANEAPVQETGTVLQQRFDISFFVDGTEITTLDQRNAILMPFFPDPVTSTSSVDDAYDHGASVTLFRDPIIRNEATEWEQTFFAYVTDPVAACLSKHDDFTLTVDVQGFASPEWNAVLDATNPANNQRLRNARNHALAEGRRMAVLQRLLERAEVIQSPDGTSGDSRIFVVAGSGDDADTIPLATLVERAGYDNLAQTQRFDGFDEMNAARASWMSDAQSGDQLEGAFEKLFAQSVVFILKQAGGTQCRF
ncbi:MAG: hypothetical protein AAGC81_09790 [Pseudomonadota bacterium]